VAYVVRRTDVEFSGRRIEVIFAEELVLVSSFPSPFVKDAGREIKNKRQKAEGKSEAGRTESTSTSRPQLP